MPIIYQELAAQIAAMPPERQADDVAVFVTGVAESYTAIEFGTQETVVHNDDQGVLDEGHYVIRI